MNGHLLHYSILYKGKLSPQAAIAALEGLYRLHAFARVHHKSGLIRTHTAILMSEQIHIDYFCSGHHRAYHIITSSHLWLCKSDGTERVIVHWSSHPCFPLLYATDLSVVSLCL